MSLFDFLNPYVTVKKFEESTRGQKESAPMFLKLLKKYFENVEGARQMEFFFYSKTMEKAESLKTDLEKLGYEVYGINESENDLFSIIGLTTPICLEEREVNHWIQRMNELGFANDCKFDGWGTLADPTSED